MPYYQLFTDGTVIVLHDSTAPLESNSSTIVKTWYLNSALPAKEYREAKEAILAEIKTIKGPARDLT